jgi:hypothetical protein
VLDTVGYRSCHRSQQAARDGVREEQRTDGDTGSLRSLHQQKERRHGCDVADVGDRTREEQAPERCVPAQEFPVG